MKNLKEQVLNFKIRCHGAATDPRRLGIHLLTQVIPSMIATNDMAFAWYFATNDVVVYNQQEYDEETHNYKNRHNMVKDEGDTTWFYEFKKGGKKRRAIITTEIWYKKNQDHSTSPIALLLGQFVGAGFHICKVKFEDAE